MGEALEKPKLMTGSNGDASYFPFARNGNVLLGVKFYGSAPGSRFGVADTTYFAARLRSAPNKGILPDEKAGKVVKLKKEPENLWDAWPEVTWEKKNPLRASTTIGTFMKGSFDEAPQLLLDNIGEGKLADQMADYLAKLAGRANMVVKKSELAAWIRQQYEPQVTRVMAAIEKQKKISEAFQESVGTFGMQAAILKKAYQSTQTDHAEDLDPHEGGDQPEDEADFHEHTD